MGGVGSGPAQLWTYDVWGPPHAGAGGRPPHAGEVPPPAARGSGAPFELEGRTGRHRPAPGRPRRGPSKNGAYPARGGQETERTGPTPSTGVWQPNVQGRGWRPPPRAAPPSRGGRVAARPLPTPGGAPRLAAPLPAAAPFGATATSDRVFHRRRLPVPPWRSSSPAYPRAWPPHPNRDRAPVRSGLANRSAAAQTRVATPAALHPLPAPRRTPRSGRTVNGAQARERDAMQARYAARPAQRAAAVATPS